MEERFFSWPTLVLKKMKVYYIEMLLLICEKFQVCVSDDTSKEVLHSLDTFISHVSVKVNVENSVTL